MNPTAAPTLGIRLAWTQRRTDIVPWVQFHARQSGRVFVAVEEVTRNRDLEDALVGALADFAFRLWPRWSGIDGSRPLPTRSADLFSIIYESTDGLSDRWLRRALKCLDRRHPPRVGLRNRQLEARQLIRVLSIPHAISGVWLPPADIEPDLLAACLISVEGFLREAELPLFVAIPHHLEGHRSLQRFGYGALRLDDQLQRPGVEGQPHPASPGERSLYEAISSDPVLRGLFRFNQQLRLDSGVTHTVDLLVPSCGLVVEVDGWQHLVQAHYEADLIRDQQLMASGYVVLRVLHTRAFSETQMVLAEIRQVLRARQKEGIKSRHAQ